LHFPVEDSPMARATIVYRPVDLAAVERGSFCGVLDDLEVSPHWRSGGGARSAGREDGGENDDATDGCVHRDSTARHRKLNHQDTVQAGRVSGRAAAKQRQAETPSRPPPPPPA